MPYFPYSEEAIVYLSRNDPALGEAISHIGAIKRKVIPDLFEALVNAIIGQQISTKAQATIWERFKTSYGSVSPELILRESPLRLQQMGISMRKASYIRSAAEKIVSGDLNLTDISTLEDEAVISRLCSLNGVGRWTAEMLMIFSLQRPDILSFGDLGILRGLRMLHGLDAIDRAQFEYYRALYSPFGSTASLYLWAVSGGAIEGLRDPAMEQPNPYSSAETDVADFQP